MRTTVHITKRPGFASYISMFGRQPRLAMNVVIGLTNTDVLDKNYGKYNDETRQGIGRSGIGQSGSL